MTTSVSDIAADAVVSSERPPETAGRSVGRDFAYIFKLLALHLRHDPVAGSLLWVLTAAAASTGGYLSLQVVIRLGAVTNGLVAHDRKAVVAALVGGAALVGIYCLYQFFLTLFGMFLRIRLRTTLVNHLVNKWFGGQKLYRPSHEWSVDHPEQRVQEDTFSFCDNAVELIPSIIGAVVSLYFYSDKLWTMSRPLPIPLPIGGAIIIPRALYLGAILTAVFVTLLVHLFGRVLTRLEVVRQRIEAGFRHDLGQAREFAEQIVLSGGQETEKARAAHDYRLICRNWTPYSFVRSSMTAVQAGTGQIGMIIPLWLLFPIVLAGQMKVGDLTVAAGSFTGVYVAFASGSSLYGIFVLLRSAAMRLHLMDQSLSLEHGSGFAQLTGSRASFILERLEVRTASGEELFRLGDLQISAREKWLVKGRSGSGKSSFFRVLAGIWPFGSGVVQEPCDPRKAMFLPQKPYLPNGSLAELLSYPRRSDAFSADDYQAVLKDVRLDRLSGEVNKKQAWSKILSPGEQQRICLARALLQRPDFLFLDEATSSLDPQTEKEVFEVMTEQLRDSAIVTIAHSDRLLGYHDHLLEIRNGQATSVGLQHIQNPSSARTTDATGRQGRD